MSLRPLVRAMEVVALLAAVAFVVLLFANEPDDPEELGVATPGPRPAAEPASGEQLYEQNCAGCHGADGSGGFAPALVDIAARYSVEEQVDVVASGQGGMPGFGGRLSDAEIEAVVEFTRHGLRTAD